MAALLIAALVSVVTVLAWETPALSGNRSNTRAELTVSFKELRAYDPATNAFTGTSYLVRTGNGLRCSAVLTVSPDQVSQIEALSQDGDQHVWSGARAEFAVAGLPDPCP